MQDQIIEMALDMLTKTMDIIGHSFGGTVALRFAVERPEMVPNMMLIEPVTMGIARVDNPKAT